MPSNQLPENFVYHSDCMVPWTELISPEEQERVEQYAADNYYELFGRVLEEDPDTSPEDMVWASYELAFGELFPEAQKKREEMEYSLALIAFEKRGAGDCSDCTHEALDEPWKDAE